MENTEYPGPGSQGDKRIWEEESQVPDVKWKARPTFLAGGSQEMDQERAREGEKDEPQDKGQETEETTTTLDTRTPNKERIRKLNTRAETSPGKFCWI